MTIPTPPRARRYRPNRVRKPETCRVCGCTAQNGCPNGCYWIAPNLCSNCGKTAQPLPA